MTIIVMKLQENFKVVTISTIQCCHTIACNLHYLMKHIKSHSSDFNGLNVTPKFKQCAFVSEHLDKISIYLHLLTILHLSERFWIAVWSSNKFQLSLIILYRNSAKPYFWNGIKYFNIPSSTAITEYVPCIIK